MPKYFTKEFEAALMNNMTKDELTMVADALALLDPLDDEGEPAGAAANQAMMLECTFRKVAEATT